MSTQVKGGLPVYIGRVPLLYAVGAGGLQTLTNEYSMYFDGVDDYVDCGNDSSLQITGAMSVSYWFKGQSATSSASGVGKMAGVRGFMLAVDNGTKAGFWIAPTSSTLESTQYSFTINTSQWYHLVGVYVPSTSLTLYLDGVQVSQNTTSIPASQYNASNTLKIGSRGDTTYFFDGNIDEVAIWNSALTATHVGEIYNATSSGKTADLSLMTTPPIVWYRMGD